MRPDRTGIVRNTLIRVQHSLTRTYLFCSKLKNWWLYLGSIMGWLIRGKRYVLRYKNGVNISFRAGTYDMLINYEIFGHGEYDKYFMTEAKNFRRFIDLGAQTGVFALYLLSRNKSLRGICVEATKENFQLLERNIKQNGFSDQVTLLHRAAWGNSGEKLVMHMSKQNSGGHSVVVNDSDREDGEIVETVSLKDIIGTESCDVLKLDIEGAEYEVLYHADTETLSKIKYIVMEAHKVGEGKDVASAERFLMNHKFNVFREGRHLWATRQDPSRAHDNPSKTL